MNFPQKISIYLFFLILIGATLTTPVSAQERLLSDAATVSLITILPGNAPEELFGHSAVRIFDPEQHLDLLFNYGTFEFDQYFLPKFIYGELNYFLSIAHTPRAIEVYRRQRRPVIEQVLNLSSSHRQDLYDFLMVNAREENRYYSYDFLFDNCSTRIRDALQTVLGGNLQYASEPDPGLSFRYLLDPYLENKSFLDFGIDLLLGTPVDQIADPWQVMFLPDFLMEAFDHAEIQTDGEWQPLVAGTETILEIEGYGNKPKTGLPWVSLFFWILLAAGIAVTWNPVRQRRLTQQRWFDIPLFAFTGLVGLLITFLWFISLHEVTANNWNLLWAWPSHLILAVLLVRRKPPDRWLKIYLGVSGGSTMIILIGWFAWPQYLHPALIPLLLLLALRSGWLALGDKVFMQIES